MCDYHVRDARLARIGCLVLHDPYDKHACLHGTHMHMHTQMEALVAGEEIARAEAKTGREELKRLRKEWLKMKDELDAEREAHKQTKVGFHELDTSAVSSVNAMLTHSFAL